MTIEEMLLGNKRVNSPSKYCSQCKEIKSIEEFYVYNRGTEIKSKCKTCVSIKKCSDLGRKISRKSNNNLRNKIIEGYGGKCNCCGYNNRHALQLDHINNNGAEEHRQIKNTRRIKNSYRGGISAYIYRKAIKENFPKDRYQLLCANCNHIKAKFGRCTCQDNLIG